MRCVSPGVQCIASLYNSCEYRLYFVLSKKRAFIVRRTLRTTIFDLFDIFRRSTNFQKRSISPYGHLEIDLNYSSLLLRRPGAFPREGRRVTKRTMETQTRPNRKLVDGSRSGGRVRGREKFLEKVKVSTVVTLGLHLPRREFGTMDIRDSPD